MMDPTEFIARLSNLRQDRAIGPPKPYKPLLVAAVVELIAKRKITTPYILLDGALKSAFDQLLHEVYPDWKFRADVRLPFRHLETDGVWRLVPVDGAFGRLEAVRAAGAKAREVLRHVACARLDDAVFAALADDAEFRNDVLARLADQYLPPEAGAAILRLLGRPDAAPLPTPPRGARPMTERAIEEFLFLNWDQTPFAAMGIALSTRRKHGLSGRQQFTPVNSMDLLGFRARRREWWVIELKRDRPADAVVGQVSRYLTWVTEERGPRGESAVGAVLAGAADTKLRYAVRANPRLSLWTYDPSFRIAQVE
jgi:hypothetical protein